jgi:hypothetical protein
MMRIEDAREIGAAKLNLSPDQFNRFMEQAKRMEVKKDDMGPMTLALAVLDAADAHKSDIGLHAELQDALIVVQQAEQEWRLDGSVRSR